MSSLLNDNLSPTSSFAALASELLDAEVSLPSLTEIDEFRVVITGVYARGPQVDANWVMVELRSVSPRTERLQ